MDKVDLGIILILIGLIAATVYINQLVENEPKQNYSGPAYLPTPEGAFRAGPIPESSFVIQPAGAKNGLPPLL